MPEPQPPADSLPAPPRARLTGWRKWALRLGLVVAAPTVFLLLLEGVLRLCGYGLPTSFMIHDPAGKAWVGNRYFTRQFAPARLAPSGEAFLIPEPKSQGVYRVVILGESAALGTPDGSYNFGRILEKLLQSRYPDRRFEVHTAAITAINSHVLLPMARECAQRRADLYILYIGNNEMVGPFAPATVFKAYSPSLPLIRTGIFVRSTRTGQLLSSWLQRDADSAAPLEWKGMETTAAGSIHPADPRRQTVHENYRRNLQDIIRVCSSSGGKVIVCTMGANLLDFPPFASLHKPGLPESALKNFDALIAQADTAAEPRAAAELLRQALAIDDQHAQTHYRLGLSLLAAGRTEDARQAMQAALDNDALQFRTDSRQNTILRALAAENGAALADIEKALAADPLGQPIPGDKLFWEHVHYRFDGNHLVARTLLVEAEKFLGRGSGEIPTAEAVGRTLALTAYDRQRMAASMFEMTSRPPFTGQFDHARRIAAGRQRLNQMNLSAQDWQASLELYDKALAAHPADWRLLLNHAELLQAAGKREEALAQVEAAAKLLPGDSEVRFQLAAARGSLGKPGALDELQAIARENPLSVAPVKTIAGIHVRQKDYAKAAEYYRKAIALRPTDSTLHTNLAAVLGELKQPEEAQRQYERAIELDHNAEAHTAMAALLRQQGKMPEAMEHARQAVLREPDSARFRNNLAVYLLAAQRVDEAVAELRLAVQKDPTYGKAAAQLGQISLARGQIREAVELLRRGVDNGADTPGNLVTLAWILSTFPQGALRNGEAAVGYAEKACRLTQNKDYKAMETLAAAYAEVGRFNSAQKTLEQAVELAPAEQRPKLQAALARYRNFRTLYQ